MSPAAQAARKADPLVELGQAGDKLRDAEEAVDAGVRSARAAGYSWERIGEALGMSKQAAWERWARLEGGGR